MPNASASWTGEHPEYHEALAGSINVAAQRLRAQGVERHDILHALADVAVQYLHPALVRGEPIDLDDYRQSLDDLGRDDTTAG